MTTARRVPLLGLVAALAGQFGAAETYRRPRSMVGSHRSRSKYMPHQGAKECARRRRQMGLESSGDGGKE